MTAELPYGRHWIDEDDIAAVNAALLSEWLTQGPAVERFEAALTEVTGARFAIATANGTAALHIACLAAGVGPGVRGITTPITFVASANCIAYCGGTPGFADVDDATVTLDPQRLEEACRQQAPGVVIPVDFAGQPADLPAIQAVARRHGATVIEDAAHALGARYTHEGREHKVGACAHAEMCVLSFHPVKLITCSEGGAVLTNDPRLAHKLRLLRNNGCTRDPELLTRNDGPWYYEQHELGFNYRMSDLEGALGRSQLGKLERFVERRRALVERYVEATADLGGELTLLLESPGRRSAYHLLVARLRGGAARRKVVFEGLRARGIRTQVHYVPVHLQPWYRKALGTAEGDLPVAEAYYASCFSLPLFPRMTDADFERSMGALRAALADPA